MQQTAFARSRFGQVPYGQDIARLQRLTRQDEESSYSETEPTESDPIVAEVADEETQDTVMSHAPTQPIALPTDSQASGGMPVWGWIAIGAAVLAVVAWLMS